MSRQNLCWARKMKYYTTKQRHSIISLSISLHTWLKLSRALCRFSFIPVGGSLVILILVSKIPCSRTQAQKKQSLSLYVERLTRGSKELWRSTGEYVSPEKSVNVHAHESFCGWCYVYSMHNHGAQRFVWRLVYIYKTFISTPSPLWWRHRS